MAVIADMTAVIIEGRRWRRSNLTTALVEIDTAIQVGDILLAGAQIPIKRSHTISSSNPMIQGIKDALLQATIKERKTRVSQKFKTGNIRLQYKLSKLTMHLRKVGLKFDLLNKFKVTRMMFKCSSRNKLSLPSKYKSNSRGQNRQSMLSLNHMAC